jgi:apolipoprotein N-acyltransferase
MPKLSPNVSTKSMAACVTGALLAAPYLMPQLFPAAWVAFVPLFWALQRAESFWRAVFYGWLAGFTAHLIGFHWLVYTISVFGGFPYPASIAIFVVFAALQGLLIALFAAALRIAGFGPLQILPALFWVALEFFFPRLFPWYLANSQQAFSWFIQTADLVGPYGASFIVMWLNAAVSHAIFAPERERLRPVLPLAYAALAVVISIIYGYQRLESVSADMAHARKINVGSVQANIDIDIKWNPELVRQNLEKHMRLTASLDGAPLVIWPESAVEFWIPENIQVLPEELTPPLKTERANFIFGARSFLGQPGTANFKAFNTAFFADDRGRVLGRYHKQVLLAFGEYLPFAKLLAHLPAIPFADGFTPGTGPRVFHLSRGARLAPLICYEDLMPDVVRRFVGQTHATVLINLTNDAWYGRSLGPWQHLWLAQFRAIETRRSLLRITNTGVTSLINAKGELVQALPMFSAAVMSSEVEVLTGETYYVAYGDWFAWTMSICAAAVLLLNLKRALLHERR